MATGFIYVVSTVRNDYSQPEGCVPTWVRGRFYFGPCKRAMRPRMIPGDYVFGISPSRTFPRRIVFAAKIADRGKMSFAEAYKRYAITGLFVIASIERAVHWPELEAYRNAHTRRQLPADADDIIVIAQALASGRLTHCISIGEYRERAYRVREDLLEIWGGISANNGYLQRSAIFPSLLDPGKFLAWWHDQKPTLVRENNP